MSENIFLYLKKKKIKSKSPKFKSKMIFLNNIILLFKRFLSNLNINIDIFFKGKNFFEIRVQIHYKNLSSKSLINMKITKQYLKI